MYRFSRSSVALSLVLTTLAASSLTACKDSTSPAVVATAARAVAIGGYQQTLTVGTTGSDSLAVAVYSTTDALLPGATVQWAISDGQGTLSSATSVTDASGVARVAFTGGTVAGVTHVSATVGTVAPAVFEETLHADAPARLIAMQAAEDTVMADSSFSGALVKVVDQYGNAVANVTVTAAIQSPVDGDVLANTVLTTDSNGVVSDAFVPTDIAGQRVLVFTTDGGLTLSYRIDVTTPDQF